MVFHGSRLVFHGFSLECTYVGLSGDNKAFQDHPCSCAENLQFCILSAGHISFNQAVDNENDMNFDENVS